ncbi:MAG: glycosyl transferase, partial [Bacteroidetes bacterium]|nr:glycosyl transferase [Bacteroidota bacterium]
MALNKKKILLLVDWFAPGYKAGGPIQSCVNFAFALRDDFDIYVLTTDTDHGETVPYENIVPNKWIAENGFHIFYTRKKTMSLKQLKQTILGADADYVYLNHFYSPYFVIYPLWLKFSGRLKSKVVLCPRGALYDSAIAVKSFKKKPFITLFRWLNMQKKIT